LVFAAEKAQTARNWKTICKQKNKQIGKREMEVALQGKNPFNKIGEMNAQCLLDVAS